MTWLGAILLAAAAGVTEILPVSGSGHFYLIEKMLGLELSAADTAAFRSALYGGTALALVLFYHRRLGQMLRDLLVGSRKPGTSLPRRLLVLLTVSSLPMFLALLLNRTRLAVEASNALLAFVSGFFALSGIVLFFSSRSAREKKDLPQTTVYDGFVMGLAQIPTVFPGLSRVGLLLSAGFLRGLDYPSALEQAGLMGIPVYLAAALTQGFGAKKLGTAAVPVQMLLAGAGISAAAGLLTLRVLTERAAYRKSTGYAYWCWGASLLALVLFLIAA